MRQLPLRRGFFPSLNSWFDDFFGESDSLLADFDRMMTIPAVNVAEHDKDYMIEVAVPGMKKQDFKISVENGMLIVTAETKEEKKEEKDSYRRREFNFQSFRRTFWLPENANPDSIDAEYKDGVLKIKLNKMKPVTEPDRKLIEVH